MLHNLCIVERSGALLLSYYFGAARTAEQDTWEASLADASRSTWSLPAGARDSCFSCDGRPVVVRVVGDLVFMLSGGPQFEELARACPARAGRTVCAHALRQVHAQSNAPCHGVQRSLDREATPSSPPPPSPPPQ